jgi:hypothetical protein
MKIFKLIKNNNNISSLTKIKSTYKQTINKITNSKINHYFIKTYVNKNNFYIKNIIYNILNINNFNIKNEIINNKYTNTQLINDITKIQIPFYTNKTKKIFFNKLFFNLLFNTNKFYLYKKFTRLPQKQKKIILRNNKINKKNSNKLFLKSYLSFNLFNLEKFTKKKIYFQLNLKLKLPK